MDQAHDIDTLMGYLGSFGKYQCFQFLLHVMAPLMAGIHMFSLVTVAGVPYHRCFIPEVDLNSTMNNYTVGVGHWETFIPQLESGEFDSCSILEYASNSTNSTSSSTCSSWVYDTTYYTSSRAIEWNFVCHRKWMGAVAKSAYMFGVLTGSATLGRAADKYGRKIIFCISATLQLILGVGVAFVPEYYTFLIIRFLYGIFGSAGCYITGYVLTIELVGTSKRTVCGVAFQASFAVGLMSVAAWGALIADRQLLQVVYGLHGLFFIAHWWLLDEFPRWLWSNGRKLEAVKLIQKALKMNGSSIKLDQTDYAKVVVKEPKNIARVGIGDLFKTPNLRKKTLNICFSWFAISLVYYALSFGISDYKGNPFLLLFLVGIVEIPGFVFTVFLMDRTGRRSLISFYMITGGICCIIATILYKGSVAAISVALVGKFFIAGAFASVYNYSAELFPTVIRNSAIGIGTMCARFSAALMPLIGLLDSFNPTIPAIIFSVITLISGFLVLLLPETLGYPMPQYIEDAESFGVGDTCFTNCIGRKLSKENSNKYTDQTLPLNIRN